MMPAGLIADTTGHYPPPFMQLSAALASVWSERSLATARLTAESTYGRQPREFAAILMEAFTPSPLPEKPILSTGCCPKSDEPGKNARCTPQTSALMQRMLFSVDRNKAIPVDALSRIALKQNHRAA